MESNMIDGASVSQIVNKAEFHVTPDKIWSYFLENKKKLSEFMVEIAHCNAFSVYLTEKDGLPYLCVDRNGDVCEDALCLTEDDASETLRSMYSTYILSGKSTNSGHCSEFSMQDIIDDRENELLSVFTEFLESVVDCPQDLYTEEGDNEIAHMMDDVLRYIAVDHGFTVYRPTFIEDEQGDERYVEYPYEQLS